MTSHVELFVIPWALYPRRVLLYLAEKGLLSSPIIQITAVTISQEGSMVAPGKPSGSVPILKLPNGTYIKQSIAILEYFEDICENPDPAQKWQVELARSVVNTAPMRGTTCEKRARTREILALADEVTSQFGLACHKGTALFVPIERTNALAANLILEYCKKNLKVLEDQFADDIGLEGGATIAHCVLYSVLQFAEELYHVDLLSQPELPALRRFYEEYKEKDIDRLSDGYFPEGIGALAKQWLPIE